MIQIPDLQITLGAETKFAVPLFIIIPHQLRIYVSYATKFKGQRYQFSLLPVKEALSATCFRYAEVLVR